MASITYKMLTAQSRLATAQQVLLEQETRHYRATLGNSAEYGGEQAINAMADKINELQTEVASLESEISTPAATDASDGPSPASKK